MRIANANREEMQELSGVHAGAGKILFNSLWGRADFETPIAVRPLCDPTTGWGNRLSPPR